MPHSLVWFLQRVTDQAGQHEASVLPNILSGAVVGMAFPALAFLIFREAAILTYKKRERWNERIAKFVTRHVNPGNGLSQNFMGKKGSNGPPGQTHHA